MMRPCWSTWIADASFGRPAVVRISPHTSTTKPAPADRRTSRMLSTWPLDVPSRRNWTSEASQEKLLQSRSRCGGDVRSKFHHLTGTTAPEASGREDRSAGLELAEEPLVKAAREQPVDAVATPEDAAMLIDIFLKHLQEGDGTLSVGNEHRVGAHPKQPCVRGREARLVEREAQRTQRDQVREPGGFGKPRRAERPRPGTPSDRRLELGEYRVDVALARVHQAGRRLVVAFGPAPIGAIDQDGIEARVGEALERPHGHAILDRRRVTPSGKRGRSPRDGPSGPRGA